MSSVIEVNDIFIFIRSGFRRPYIKGNWVVKEGHIFDLRMQKKPSGLKVFALYLGGSDVNKKPHRINMCIKKQVLPVHC